MGIFKRIVFLARAEINAAKNKLVKRINDSGILKPPDEEEEAKVEEEREEARKSFEEEWQEFSERIKKKISPANADLIKNYEILGAKPEESLESITKKWRDLLRKHHPDKFTDVKGQKRALEETKKINEAYTAIEKEKSK